MKNVEVAERFVNRSVGKTKNLFVEFDERGVYYLYSYGKHFPVGIKLIDGTLLVNNDGWSKTTAIHKGHLCRALGFENFKDLVRNRDTERILLKDTEALKQIFRLGIKSKAEILEQEI